MAHSRQSHRQPHSRLSSSPAERVIAVARRHFLSHGFRHVTMDELARELGMSKKTLYASFPSKTTLLESVLAEKFRQVEDDLTRITSHCSSDVLGALRQLLACLHHHTDEIKPSFVRDMQRESQEVFRKVEDRRRTVIQRHFGTVLRAGRKTGIIRKDIPTDVIVEILLSSVQAIMNPSKIIELNLTPKTGFAAIVTVVLEGVLADRETR